MAVKIKLRSDHVLPRDLALSMSSSPYFACKRYLNSSPDTYAAAHSQDKIISTLPVPMTWAVANFQHSLPHHTRPIDHHIGHHPGSFTFESQGKSLSSLFSPVTGFQYSHGVYARSLGYGGCIRCYLISSSMEFSISTALPAPPGKHTISATSNAKQCI